MTHISQAAWSSVNEGPEMFWQKSAQIFLVAPVWYSERFSIIWGHERVIFSEIGWVLEFEIPNDSKWFGMIHSFACLVYRPCVLTFQYAEIRENMAGQSGSKMKGAATQILYLCRKSTYIYVPKCFYRFCLQ